MEEIEKLINSILSRYDLSTEEGRDRAYAECIDYAENELSHDIICNNFLRRAAEILEKEPVEYDVIREMLDMPSDAEVDISYDERHGFIITGNSSGLHYLSDILRMLAEAPEGEHVHLYNDEEPLTHGSFNSVIYVESDEWFRKLEEEEDRLGSMEDFPKRTIAPEDIFALQIVGDLPPDLALARDNIYRVESFEKIVDEGTWKKTFSGNSDRYYTFHVIDENGDDLDISLHLDDPDVNFFKKADFVGLLD